MALLSGGPKQSFGRVAGREWGHTKPGVMIGYRTLASDAHVQLVKVEHSGGRSQLTTGDDNPKCMYITYTYEPIGMQ